jgi:flagellar assembly factor FliW
MKWNNRQFGEFLYEEQHVISFPCGLIGFEETRKYILINDESSQPFLWLVSLEDSELSFPVVVPTFLAEGYAADVSPKDETSVLAVVCLRDKIEESTVNLRSPILIEKKNQVGKQIVLENDRYPFRHPLFAAAAQTEKG